MDIKELTEASEIKTRRDCALWMFDYLRKELKEPEEADISPAEVLRDLYDCRVCVNAIAQLYLKGIMDPVVLPGDPPLLLFDGKRECTPEEKVLWAGRLTDPGKRCRPLG